MKTREKVRESQPGISFGDIGRKMGEMWASMSLVEREPYIAQANQDKERYTKEKAVYDAR